MLRILHTGIIALYLELYVTYFVHACSLYNYYSTREEMIKCQKS